MSLNLEMFTNKNEITKDQFEDIKKSEKYEIYSQASIAKFIEDTTNSIEKAESGDLKEGEQEKLDIAKAQVLTLSPIVVLNNEGDNQITKSVYYIREKIKEVIDEDDLEKGGEGSKGGNVIGHTKSGKPIYNSFSHEGHDKFTTQDHKDAAIKHAGLEHIASYKGKKMKENYHNTESHKHSEAARNSEAHSYQNDPENYKE